MGEWANGRTADGLAGRHISLLFQEQIQAPKNASIARFDGLCRYQRRSEKTGLLRAVAAAHDGSAKKTGGQAHADKRMDGMADGHAAAPQPAFRTRKQMAGRFLTRQGAFKA